MKIYWAEELIGGERRGSGGWSMLTRPTADIHECATAIRRIIEYDTRFFGSPREWNFVTDIGGPDMLAFYQKEYDNANRCKNCSSV